MGKGRLPRQADEAGCQSQDQQVSLPCHTPTHTWENWPEPEWTFGRGDASDNAVKQEADLLSLS